MNTAGILHIPDSRYCFALSTKELVIRLRVAKEDNDIAVTLVYGPKYHYHEYQKNWRCMLLIPIIPIPIMKSP